MRDGVLCLLRHLSVGLAFVLKTRIPSCRKDTRISQTARTLREEKMACLTKVGRPSRRHNSALQYRRQRGTTSRPCYRPGVRAYIRPSLKNLHSLPRALTVSECADRLRRLVFESREELVEVLNAEGFEEPFSR